MDTWTLTRLLAFILPVAGEIVNVALNKPANMSSYYGQGALRAGGAVDGKRASRWPNIINTAENHTFAWWKLDLEREVQDATVRIYFRTDYKYRRNGVKLYTSTRPFLIPNPTSRGQLCHTLTGSHHGADIPDIISIICPRGWRFLMVYTNTRNDRKGAVLDFGEVEVDGCSPNSYGLACNRSCQNRHCVTLSRVCDPLIGKCRSGCEQGWIGVDCTSRCPNDTFGSDCTSCSTRHCQGESDCPADGKCSQGCQDGWTSINCTKQCQKGTYGPDCSNDCSQCQTGCEPVPEECRDHCGETRDRINCDISEPSTNSRSGDLLIIMCASVGGGIFLIFIIIGVICKR